MLSKIPKIIYFRRYITSILFLSGYYGISMVSVKLGTNAHISHISTALMGIPAYIFCICLMDRWGRKPICCFGFILCGIVSIPAGFAGGHLQLVLTLVGRFLHISVSKLIITGRFKSILHFYFHIKYDLL